MPPSLRRRRKEGGTRMKRYYIATVAIALAVILIYGYAIGFWNHQPELDHLKVGFIYENDGSTPFTYNFMLAQSALENTYGERVKILAKNNVHGKKTEESLRDLVQKGCRIIFINTDSTQVRPLAEEIPSVQFCQISVGDAATDAIPSNYHTFGGEIYQGRYVSGIAAGMKLKQMIDTGVISSDEALVGFVGAFPVAEVISGYTAFLLGVRSVVPEAVMRVRYTNTWSSYTLEKACAQALIEEGCVVISQHTNTTGPAVACEEAAATRPVIHIGYNQSTIDIAPTASLVSARINWTPYITGAVAAMLSGHQIEEYVDGSVHGNDMSAGLEKNWVEMLELNPFLAAEGTAERMAQAVEAFRKGKLEVFKGNYIGVNPDDPSDTCDLNQGYTENKDCSCPDFHYVLKDIITVEE